MNAVAIETSSGLLSSPLRDVPDSAWDAFVRLLATRPLSFVGPNRLGMFEMRPRRLGDLGLMRDLRALRTLDGPMAWTGAFVSSAASFLSDPGIQYRALRASLSEYAERIANHMISVPDGTGLSGALAILHRADIAGLTGKRFPETEAIYRRAKDVF